jgi:iron complex outermembrane receptor protein
MNKINLLSFLAFSFKLGSLAQSTSPAPQIKTDKKLDDIVVAAKKQSSYNPTQSSSAAKTELPLIETPQSVKVIDQALLLDIAPVRLEDTFDYVSGVNRQNPFGGMWENYAVRGFTGDSNNFGLGYLINGIPGNRGFNAPRDLTNIEKVEFLKGPSAAIYGASDPGGTINLVTKRPTFDTQHSIEAQAGSFNFYRVAMDSTAPLTENFAYRFNYAYEDSDSFRDTINYERKTYALALTWKLADSTTLEYTGEFLEHQTQLDRGVVFVNGDLGTMPISRFYGDPRAGDITNRNILNQLRLTHSFNDQWSIRATVSHKSNILRGYGVDHRDLQTADTLIRTRLRLRDYQTNDWTGQIELLGKFDTGTIKHETMLGFESYWFSFDQTFLSGNYPGSIPLNNPTYTGNLPALTPVAGYQRSEVTQNTAFYAQDVMKLGSHWNLILGLRNDHFRRRIYNRENDTAIYQDESAWTPRASLSFLPTQNSSIYLSYSQSFRPSFGTDANGQGFDPEQGDAYEIGTKIQTDDQRFGATLAFFHIQKENVTRADPLDPNGINLAIDGEVRSRGIELDLAGELWKGFRLNASATYLSAKTLESQSVPGGTPLLNIPTVTANLLGVQEWDLQGYGKIGLGAGVIYVGERSANDNNSLQLPDYHLVRLLAYWEVSPHLRLTFDVDNLFQKTYYKASLNNRVVAPGSPRTLMFGVKYTF